MLTESETVVRGLGAGWLAVVVTCWVEMTSKVSLVTPAAEVLTASVSVVAARLSV
jgi:hypothetical protein